MLSNGFDSPLNNPKFFKISVKLFALSSWISSSEKFSILFCILGVSSKRIYFLKISLDPIWFNWVIKISLRLGSIFSIKLIPFISNKLF